MPERATTSATAAVMSRLPRPNVLNSRMDW
jgi:hypothetical protein